MQTCLYTCVVHAQTHLTSQIVEKKWGGGHIQNKVEKKLPQKHTLSQKQTTHLVHNSYEKKNWIPNHKRNPKKSSKRSLQCKLSET